MNDVTGHTATLAIVELDRLAFERWLQAHRGGGESAEWCSGKLTCGVAQEGAEERSLIFPQKISKSRIQTKSRAPLYFSSCSTYLLFGFLHK